MTSRRLEHLHELLLRKILSQSGLECSKSVLASQLSEESLEETEDIDQPDEESPSPQDVRSEEEPTLEITEDVVEAEPDVFPTPSLRRMLPDKTRNIQMYNRIHVLPENFKTTIDPSLIPKIATTVQQKYIDVIADLVGCTNYRSSMAEYWFLETMANLLRRAQEDDLSRPTQAILMLWFCEWMKEMQQFDAADRQRMMRRFEDNMLSAARIVALEQQLPTPAEAGVDYRDRINTGTEAGQESVTPATGSQTQSSVPRASQVVSFEGNSYQCACIDLAHIIHYIYDLFSSDYQYNLVRSIFTFGPEYTLMDTPYQLHTPKRMYAPLKIKKEKTPRKEKKKRGKEAPDTEEYIALMALKAKEALALDEQEELDREQWNKRSCVLPLGWAAEQALFDKYWPPPPEPEPLPEPEPKKKNARKKK